MDYTTQIQQLESLLPLIESTRSSLPSLVSSLSPPTTSPHSPLDLATLYKLASTQCQQTINLLSEQLEKVETTLDLAEESFKKDQNGVVVVKQGVKDKDPWQRIGETLTGTSRTRSKGNQVFEPRLEAPKSKQELVQFLKTWETSHPRVTFDPVRGTEGGNEEQETTIEVKLKGVMRAVIVVRWENSSLAMVELAACFSLKENNTLYRPSRFSLFQELTNSLMSLIDKSQSRPGDQTSNLEEVLTFLSNPPLPF
ncbi:hypothetical protein JCM5350_005807 [Sporobolomyces pararoseus]